MFNTSHLTKFLPPKMQSRVDAYFEALEVLTAVKDPKVMSALGPSGIRGLFLRRGRQGKPTDMPASHKAHFDWTYPSDQPEMVELYRRAKTGQWDGDSLPWHIDVDPMNPEREIVRKEFFSFELMEEAGVKLKEIEKPKLT